MSPPPLRLEQVWKAYPRWPSGTRTVRSVLSRRAPLLLRRGERRWALRDVSLGLEPGGSLGVIGPNGAGKSTLLRLAAGLGKPTRGRVSAPGRTAAVLGLGAWFDLALTGRENAMTALTVLGWRRATARALVPAALEFAELEEFADAPVRIYSEGMKLRLAFGVIAQLEPDVLLVDEVLAVGDLAFQAKCIERIESMRARGTGLVLASHDLHQVVDQCDEALWLHRGRVRALGDAAGAVSGYREAGRTATVERTPAHVGSSGDGLELRRNRFGSQELTVGGVTIHGPGGAPASELPSGGSMAVSLELEPRESGLSDPIVQLTAHRASDEVVCLQVDSTAGGLRLGEVSETVRVTLAFDRLELVPGEYLLDVGVYQPDWEFAYDFHWHAYRLRVTGPGAEGVVRPAHRWEARPAREAVSTRPPG